MSKCRDCARPIVFVHISTTRKAMPVDAAPDDGGNVFARMVGGRLAGHVRVTGEDLPDGWRTYMPHAATCESRLRDRRQAGSRGAPGPKTQPSLFDPPQAPGASAPGQQEGTA